MSSKDLECYECIHGTECPVGWSRHNAACLTIRKPYEIAPMIEMRLYVRNVHMFDEKLLSNAIKKIDSDEIIFTPEEKMALYGVLRNQYIRITGHDLL